VSATPLRNPDFAARVKRLFEAQPYMRFIGASLVAVTPGYVEIALPFKPEIAQHHGYFHGAVIGALADNAGGFAAQSVLAKGFDVLTVEYKLNIVAPGKGERLVARGQVLRPGRTLVVSRSDVYVVEDGTEKLCAACQMTLMAVASRPLVGRRRAVLAKARRGRLESSAVKRRRSAP